MTLEQHLNKKEKKNQAVYLLTLFGFFIGWLLWKKPKEPCGCTANNEEIIEYDEQELKTAVVQGQSFAPNIPTSSEVKLQKQLSPETTKTATYSKGTGGTVKQPTYLGGVNPGVTVSMPEKGCVGCENYK